MIKSVQSLLVFEIKLWLLKYLLTIQKQEVIAEWAENVIS